MLGIVTINNINGPNNIFCKLWPNSCLRVFSYQSIDWFDYCLKPVDEEDAEQLLIRLKQHFDSQRQENNVHVGNSSDIIIEIQNSGFKKMIEYINEHYYEKLKLSDLSNMFYINTKYCCSLIHLYKCT